MHGKADAKYWGDRRTGAFVCRAARGMLAGALLACAAGALAGCAFSHAMDNRPTAECPVCRCNADLGCLVVHIDDSTPRSIWQGKTYYFCSLECKTAFDLAPEKYARR